MHVHYFVHVYHLNVLCFPVSVFFGINHSYWCIHLSKVPPLTDECSVFEVPPLHQAVFSGDIEETERLIRAGEDPNQRIRSGPKICRCVQDGWNTMYGYFDGTTPLMIASQRGHLKIVKYLRNQGAKIARTDCLGFNAFLLACGTNQLDVCRYLSRHGAPLEFRDELNGMTPLLIACRTRSDDVARWLIEKGANVHVCDFTGRGSLHFAAWNFNIILMQLLVSQHVKINCKDRDGNTPLHLLLSGFPLEHPTTEEFLEQQKEVDTVKRILGTMAKIKESNVIVDMGLTYRRGTADLMSKSYEKWKSLSGFIKLGADPNVKNREGQTPMQVLLENLPEAYISKGRVIVFEPNKNQELLVLLLILLKLGADPEIKLKNGDTINSLYQVKKNAIARRILNKYQNIVSDITCTENDDIVEETIARHGAKYLMKLKAVESEIEALSDMVIEPERPPAWYEVVLDRMASIYRYIDSTVNG